MKEPVAEKVNAADSSAGIAVDEKKILARIDRLRSSSLTLSIYLIPLIFLALVPLVWLVSGRLAGTFVAQLFETVFQSFLLSLLLAFGLYYALMQLLGVYERHKEILVVEGQLEEAKLMGEPKTWGGAITQLLIKRVLCILWEPTSHGFGRKVPVLAVRYSFKVNGKEFHRQELVYADEVISQDAAGQTWVLVDPRAPKNRSFLLRAGGQPEDKRSKSGAER